jgi:Protein of unknown function (DUF3558)
MGAVVRRAVMIGVAIILAGCSGSATPPAGGGGGATPAPSSTSAASAAAVGSLSPSAAASSAAGAPVSDPCSLLTQAEVSAALGVSVGPGGPAQGETHGCSWQTPSGAPSANIVIDVGTPFSHLCGAPSNPAAGITVVQISGVGDGACYITMAGLSAGTNLTFEKGGQAYAVSVSLPSGTDATVEAANKTLALDAVAKL